MLGVQVVSFAIFAVASGSLVTFTQGIDVLGGPEALGITLADIGWGLVVLAGSSGAAAGVFPRELTVTENQKTLLLTNFGSKTLAIIDIAQLPIDSQRE